jgi:hypothetical protein
MMKRNTDMRLKVPVTLRALKARKSQSLKPWEELDTPERPAFVFTPEGQKLVENLRDGH